MLFSITEDAGAAVTLSCPSNMIHYWKFDETEGSSYADSAGSSTATCTTCPTVITGVVNGAQQFTQSTNVNAANDSSFDFGPADSFSIELWMKTDATNTCSGKQVLLGRDDTPTGSLSLWVACMNGGTAAFNVQDEFNAGGYVQGGKLLNTGKWRHIVAVRDGVNGSMSLYVDGQLDATSSGITTPGGFSSPVPLNIGWLNQSGSSGYHFTGSIDEVAVYNRVLTQNEVSSHYYLARPYCETCSRSIRIMPVGDSITEGCCNGLVVSTDYDHMASYRQTLYLDLAGSNYDVDFVGSMQFGNLLTPLFDADNEGHPGWTAGCPAGVGQVIQYISSWLAANPPEVVLLHIGTNDVANDCQSVSYISGILDKIFAFDKNITVLLARIIREGGEDPLTGPTHVYNDAVQAMAQTRIANGDKIIMVDEEDALTYPGDLWDGLHPIQSGYNKMAVPWFTSLSAFLPAYCAQTSPQIYSTPTIFAHVGLPYTYNVNARAIPVPTYSLIQAPSWLTINPVGGLIQGIPPSGSAGQYTVTVQAANSLGTDTQTFTLQVFDTFTLWSNTTVPSVISTDTNAIEVGLKFRSDVNGYITGLRFYKGATNTGTHIGNLWTSMGTLLASVTFTNETASGWQQVALPTPVAINENTTYIASYHTNVGHYAVDSGYLSTSSYYNPPLRALQDGTDGYNAVYHYGTTSSFPNQPTQGYSGMNYWVDVVFTASTGTVDHITISPSLTTITAGGSQSYKATSFDQYDNSLGDVTASTTFSITPDGSCTATACASIVAGSHTVTGTYGGKTATATLAIDAGPFDHITVSPASATTTAGIGQSFTATAFDQYDNSLGDVTASTTFSITPDGSCTGASCTATVTGSHTVTGIYSGKNATATVDVFANQPIRIFGVSPLSYFSSIDAAYDTVVSGDTIQACTGYFSEIVNFTRDVMVTIEGGYDPSYTDNIGYTSISGTVTISAGTVTVGNLEIQ
ncbi:MAG TPA: DUF4082 domain-containing protein [Thermodesulfovibrionales bacterium]|nr:DUF4082 domain-containing protein [Thermodesulfovibrionales bacterium]